jgi:putative nucleotidyltransferase with HDIG domain
MTPTPPQDPSRRPPASPPREDGLVASPAPPALAAALPSEVRAVLARLAAAGHEAVAVGGCVRDVLLGRTLTGYWDLATKARPEEVVALFPRSVPTGIEHGTVTLPAETGPIEITSYRSDHGYSDARRPDRVTFGVSLAGDLQRRDFTVNALAYDPAHELVLDGTGGLADLDARVLRAVGDPVARFREDALRPLRAARLAALLEFTIEPHTRAALAAVTDLVPKLSAERVRDELSKLLSARAPSHGFEVLRTAGILSLALPELAATIGVMQNKHHAWDVYEHTLRAVDLAPSDRPRVRWAALLHDLGKPGTRAVREDGEATFHGHPALGAEIADRALERLRLPRAEREAIVLLVKEHLFDYRPEWSDAAVRRFLKRVGTDNLDDLLALRRADAAATRPGASDLGSTEALVARIEAVARAKPPLAVRDLAIGGRDVIETLGVPPGPEVGRALDALLEDVLEDPTLNVREILLERLVARRAERPPAP